MSTNIHLHATREITVNKTGKVESQSVMFKTCWQTPTEVTKRLLESSNPTQSYFEWVKEVSSDKEIAINHIIDVLDWIKTCEYEGYETEWVGW